MTPPEESPGRPAWWERPLVWLAPVLLVAAAVLVYAGSLDGPFVFDDYASIVEDESIRSFGSVWQAAPGSNANGRPVTSLSLALNYALGGLEVFGYHLFNVLLHGAVAALLFDVLRRALGARARRLGHEEGNGSAPLVALAAAALWVVHPLTTDAMNQVVSRNEGLMALFYLAALSCALRAFASARPRAWLLACLASSFLAMGSKETAVSLPLAILCCERVCVGPSFRAALVRRRGFYAALLLPVAWVLWISLTADRGESVGFEMKVTPGKYALAQLEILTHYLRLCFWPDPLVADYGDWASWRGPRAPWLEGALLLGLLASCVVGTLRGSLAALLGFVAFQVLAPTSSFIPLTGEIAAEHRMYFPLALLIAALVVAAHGLARRAGLPRTAGRLLSLALLLPALVALGLTTVERNAIYADEVELWEATRRDRPTNLRGWTLLAQALERRGRAGDVERAVDVHAGILRIEPRLAATRKRLIELLRALGREAEAARIAREGAELVRRAQREARERSR